jgi:hypothetical protein
LTLSPNIVIKNLDRWSNVELIKAFSRELLFIKMPDKYRSEIEFRNGWTKESIQILSDKLNQLWASELEKGSEKTIKTTGTNYFLINYIILNYICDRKSVVDKSTIDKLSEWDKLRFSGLLKLPIDISNIRYLNLGLTTKSIPYIIKKDYEHEISIDHDLIIPIIEHLDGFKLNLRMSKSLLNSFTYKNRSIPGKSDNKVREKVMSVLGKFKTRPRVGDSVVSDDGLLKFTLY